MKSWIWWLIREQVNVSNTEGEIGGIYGINGKDHDLRMYTGDNYDTLKLAEQALEHALVDQQTADVVVAYNFLVTNGAQNVENEAEYIQELAYSIDELEFTEVQLRNSTTNTYIQQLVDLALQHNGTVTARHSPLWNRLHPEQTNATDW